MPSDFTVKIIFTIACLFAGYLFPKMIKQMSRDLFENSNRKRLFLFDEENHSFIKTFTYLGVFICIAMAWLNIFKLH